MKKILLICLSVLLLLSGCGKQKSPEITWQEQFDLGVRYLSEGNYEEAILAFQIAIEIDPKRMEAYMNLSDAWIMKGDPQMALEVLYQGLDATESEELEKKLKDLERDLQEENDLKVDQEHEESEQNGVEVSSLVFEATEEQKIVLDELCRLLEAEEYVAAANCAIDMAELMMPFMDGNVYLYYDGVLHSEIEGAGLVVQTAWKDSVGVIWACYYGTFGGGIPDGACQYFQVGDSYITNERYYYVVEGSWNGGELNGTVKTDQYAYANPSHTLYRTTREGDVKDGLAEGQFMITEYYSSGHEKHFLFTASEGYPVADDTWDSFDDGTPCLRCQEYYPGVLGPQGAALTEDYFLDILWNPGFWER